MTNKTLTTIGIVLIIIISGIFGACIKGYFTPDCPQIKSDTTQHQNLDTNKYVAKTKYVPYPVYQKVDSQAVYITFKSREPIILKPKDSAKTKTDSIKVFNDYFDTKFDTITLTNKNDLWYFLHYGITQNRLISADGKYVNKRVTENIINTPMQPLKNMLFIGGGLGANTDLFSLNGRVTLKTKRNVLYTPEIEYIPILSKHPVFKFAVQFNIF